MNADEKSVMLAQLNKLMTDAAGDQELIRDAQSKLAELNLVRRQNVELKAALEAERLRAETAEARLASVAQDAEAAARAIGDQMLREKAAKDNAQSALGRVGAEANARGTEAAGLRAENERYRLEAERLRADVAEERERAAAAEEGAAEHRKLLHVMRAEHESDVRERADLEAKVAQLAETVTRVRRAENDAATARCALDTEVAALAHAVSVSATRGPPLAPLRVVPPMPANKLLDAPASVPGGHRTPLGSGRATPRSARGAGAAYGRQQ